MPFAGQRIRSRCNRNLGTVVCILDEEIVDACVVVQWDFGGVGHFTKDFRCGPMSEVPTLESIDGIAIPHYSPYFKDFV